MLNEWSPLLILLGVVVTAIFSAGGISALARLRHDKRIGVASQEVAEDDAEARRWQAIIETQTRALVEPLRHELQEVRGRVSALELELANSRRKYWLAISYIRTLLTWIGRNMPEDAIEHTAVPEPSPILVEDI